MERPKLVFEFVLGTDRTNRKATRQSSLTLQVAIFRRRLLIFQLPELGSVWMREEFAR